MNRAKLISILRGDPIEQFLEDIQRKLEARGLAWLTKVGLLILALAMLGGIALYDATLKP